GVKRTPVRRAWGHGVIPDTTTQTAQTGSSRARRTATVNQAASQTRHRQRRAQMTVQRLKLAGVVIGCFAFLAAAPGVAFAQSKCTGGELKAASKGAPLDTGCTGKAVTKFGASWAKATAVTDCLTTIDATTIENKVDAFAADVNSELTAAGPTTTTTTTASTTTTTGGVFCGI